jgi:hypothetical protein
MDDPIIEESYGTDRDAVYTSLDDREALERQLADVEHSPELTLRRWREATSDATTGDEIRDAFNALGGNLWDPVEGTSWLHWAGWFSARLLEATTTPGTVLGDQQLPDRYTWRRRSTTPLVLKDEELLLHLATRAHRTRIDRWLTTEPATGLHLHLLLDSEEELGEISDLTDEDVYGDQDIIASRVSSRVGLRLGRTLTGNGMRARVLGLHIAEPVDDSRAEAWRKRWPALYAALGGYFSDSDRLSPRYDQRRMLFTESPAFLDRVAAEGDELLTLDDADLHTAVVALGCFVEPPHLRLWLTWMFWRIREFDWSEPPTP